MQPERERETGGETYGAVRCGAVQTTRPAWELEQSGSRAAVPNSQHGSRLGMRQSPLSMYIILCAFAKSTYVQYRCIRWLVGHLRYLRYLHAVACMHVYTNVKHGSCSKPAEGGRRRRSSSSSSSAPTGSTTSAHRILTVLALRSHSLKRARIAPLFRPCPCMLSTHICNRFATARLANLQLRVHKCHKCRLASLLSWPRSRLLWLTPWPRRASTLDSPATAYCCLSSNLFFNFFCPVRPVRPFFKNSTQLSWYSFLYS